MSKPRRERRSVTAVEALGPYALIRVDRGQLDPGAPGQFFMLEAPGRVLPRPMSLCLAPRGELAFLVDPIGPGTRALASLTRGDRLQVFGPLDATRTRCARVRAGGDARSDTSTRTGRSTRLGGAHGLRVRRVLRLRRRD